MNGPPVGVFDSGVGGLSVLREIRTLLPQQNLLYVADSAHCPYGIKSQTQIRQRSLAMCDFLLNHGARAIVVACNTATAAAIESLRERYPEVPIVGMEPGIKPAVAATRSGVVGVLATGATLKGQRFAGLVQRFSDGVEFLTQACVGLVEQVEAGDLDGPATRDLLRAYVGPLLARGADTLVLGCTHYPFLRATLADLVGPGCVLVDTGAAVGRQTARVLGAARPVAPSRSFPFQQGTGGCAGGGRTRFYSTDMSVAPVMARLWGTSIDVEAVPAY